MKLFQIFQKPFLALSFAASLVVVFSNCDKNSDLHQMPDGAKFTTFQTHVQNVANAKFSDFAGQADFAVRNEAEFEKMKKHIQFMYEGIEVKHSFLTKENEYVDCIPVDQQPSLKQEGLASREIDTAPEPDVAAPDNGQGHTAEGAKSADVRLKAGDFDQFGNERFCPQGFIPMMRLTLEQMMRFETLDNFFSKNGKGGGGESVQDGATDRAVNHYYAHAYQFVNNYGGDSWLNLWNPSVAASQFSLSQQWYVGGSGSGLQTVEGGWQRYPSYYGGSAVSRLFIYYTKANYAPGTGYYNLSGPGFVQTNGSIVLGGTFSNYSSFGGTQYEFGMQWKRASNGNWWLYYKTASTTIAVGYYPRTLYGTGQLAYNAQRIDFGGEVTGNPHSLQMGSGNYASSGYRWAAYQRQNFFINTANTSVWCNLTKSSSPANCYTINYFGPTGSGSWVEYFYFGGPSCN